MCGGGIYGSLCLGTIDKEYCYDHDSLINIYGTLVLEGCGRRQFAPGVILYIGKNAELSLRGNFSASHDLKIYCRYKISIGKDNMWSYFVVVMDNDGHYIYNDVGKQINANKEVVFGDHVWLGCRCTVLKGSHIPNGSVIGAGSTIRKVLQSTDSIYAGNGPLLIKKNVNWDRKLI